jgi:CRISPR-associated protein Cmr4
MNTCLLGLLAETSIHPGAGQSSGIVDLPVAREAATDYPVIPGSSLKGALLGLARQRELNEQERMNEQDRNRIFGRSDNAGALLVSDARLLLLPVRSLSSAYKWVTCPHLLERFSRDQQRANKNAVKFELTTVEAGKYLGVSVGTLFLEERQFEHEGELPGGVVPALETLVPAAATYARTRTRLAGQLVLLHDDDFAWFARYGLAIQARNALDPEKKTSANLWYEETIPADALFYAVFAERGVNTIEPVKGLFKDRPYLQVGGNETVGMGWFAVAFPATKGATA